MDERRSSLMALAGVGLGVYAAARFASRRRRHMDFRGKVVVITGGSRGLGLLLARRFGAEGARLVICGRDDAELGRAEKDLRARGVEVKAVHCDVRLKIAVEDLVRSAVEAYGGVDVLVNNAGVIQVGPLELMTEADYDEAMDTHFWGPLHAMMAVYPLMRGRGGGRIVNISSIGGKIAVPHLAPYCASKFALAGLSSALHTELAKDNVFVTTVYPGLMRTGSHINALFKGQHRKEFALFSLANGLPFTSVSAESAARQIIAAVAGGKSELIISVQARTAAKINALLPEATAAALAIIDRLLPENGGIGPRYAAGYESTSAISPSILTSLLDNASVRNNEIPAPI